MLSIVVKHALQLSGLSKTILPMKENDEQMEHLIRYVELYLE